MSNKIFHIIVVLRFYFALHLPSVGGDRPSGEMNQPPILSVSPRGSTDLSEALLLCASASMFKPEVEVLGVLQVVISWVDQVRLVLVPIVDVEHLGPDQSAKPLCQPHH